MSLIVLAIEETLKLKLIDFKGENLIQIYVSLPPLIESHQLMLLEILDILEEITQHNPEKKQLVRTLRALLKKNPCLQQIAIQNTNGFLDYKNKCNDENTGLCILDQYGHFVLSDAMTRNILEINNRDDLNQRSLFSYISKASEFRLKTKYRDQCMLNSYKTQEIYEFSIYSDRNRKKSLKYLNQLASMKKTNKSQLKADKVKNKTQEILSKLSREHELQIKYLKTVQITIRKVNFLIQESFLQILEDSEDLLVSNNETLCNIDQVVVCEIRESDAFEKLTLEELYLDPYIMKHENKWNNRINKLNVN